MSSYLTTFGEDVPQKFRMQESMNLSFCHTPFANFLTHLQIQKCYSRYLVFEFKPLR